MHMYILNLSMATPMEIFKAVMPHGTATVIADLIDLSMSKGNEAMEYILDAAGDAPWNLCHDAFIHSSDTILRQMGQILRRKI